jgi:hypothetical protein
MPTRACTLACSWLALSLPMAVAAGAAETAVESFDPIVLQDAFAHATDLKLVNSVGALPEDAQRVLRWLARLGDEEWPVIADIGADWSSSDAPVPGRPTGQHRFSAVSEELFAILYVQGGHGGAKYVLILAPRSSERVCLYYFTQRPSDESLSVSALQYHFLTRQQESDERAPVCQVYDVQ